MVQKGQEVQPIGSSSRSVGVYRRTTGCVRMDTSDVQVGAGPHGGGGFSPDR